MVEDTPDASILAPEGKLLVNTTLAPDDCEYDEDGTLPNNTNKDITETITYRLVRVFPDNSDDYPSLKNDWKSSRLLSLNFQVPGILVHPIIPVVSTRVAGKPFYLFDSGILMALGSNVHDRISPI